MPTRILLSLFLALLVSRTHQQALFADTVSLGDAEVEIYTDGTIGPLVVNGTSSPISYTNHFVSVDGGEPYEFFAFTSSGVTVAGNTATIDLLGTPAMSNSLAVQVMMQLDNPTDGDSFAGIDVSVRFENLTAAPMNLQFYSYLDFDLDPANFAMETATFDGTSIRQSSIPGLIGRDAIFTPQSAFDHWEINQAATVQSALTTVNSPFDLADATSGLETDIEVSFQFDRSLAAGASETIEYSLEIVPVTAVPEPSVLVSICLLAIPAYTLGRRKRVSQRG